MQPIRLILCSLLLLSSCSSNNSAPEDDAPAFTTSPVVVDPDVEPVPNVDIADVLWGLVGYTTPEGEEVSAAYVPPYSMEIFSEGSAAIAGFRASLQCGLVSGEYSLDGRLLTTLDVWDTSESIGCVPTAQPSGDVRTDAFIIDFFVGTNTFEVDIVDEVLALTSTTGAIARFSEFNEGVVAFRTLAEGVDGGPAFTDDLSDAGLHLRQFQSYTDADLAFDDFSAMNLYNDLEWDSAVDVLREQGGTLVALYPGLQTSMGAVGSSVVGAAFQNGQLRISVRTTTHNHCSADSAFGSPYSIVHINSQATDVVFNEAIVPCSQDDADAPVDDVRDIRVEFTQDNTAVITWTAPESADDNTRYDVIQQNGEQGTDVYDGVDEPRYEIEGLIPGLIYTYRIQPVGPGFDTDAPNRGEGSVIALNIGAPSAYFKGRVQRSDLEAYVRAISGVSAIDCGDDVVVSSASQAEEFEALSCAENALANGEAFYRLWTFSATEGEAVRALVGDENSNVWLIDYHAPDVNISNPFTPSLQFGGYMVGENCSVPMIVEQSGRVNCTN